MKRWTFFLLSALLVLSSISVSTAAAQGAHPKATGEVGWVYGGLQRYASFNAHDTDPAKGDFYYHDSAERYIYAEVVCFNLIDESTVVFTSEVTDTNIVAFENAGFITTTVVDGGTPGSNGDLIQNLAVSNPEDCHERILPGLPVTEGNLVVHD